jgi:hypothetical protein
MQMLAARSVKFVRFNRWISLPRQPLSWLRALLPVICYRGNRVAVPHPHNTSNLP